MVLSLPPEDQRLIDHLETVHGVMSWKMPLSAEGRSDLHIRRHGGDPMLVKKLTDG